MVAGAVLVQEAGGTVLFSNGATRRWSDWETFVQRALKTPFGQDPVALRKLYIYMLAGNSQVVQQRASQMTIRRPSVWGKARRRLRTLWRTVTGKERKGQGAR
jgi:hypothetical protein